MPTQWVFPDRIAVEAPDPLQSSKTEYIRADIHVGEIEQLKARIEELERIQAEAIRCIPNIMAFIIDKCSNDDSESHN